MASANRALMPTLVIAFWIMLGLEHYWTLLNHAMLVTLAAIAFLLAWRTVATLIGMARTRPPGLNTSPAGVHDLELERSLAAKALMPHLVALQTDIAVLRTEAADDVGVRVDLDRTLSEIEWWLRGVRAQVQAADEAAAIVAHGGLDAAVSADVQQRRAELTTLLADARREIAAARAQLHLADATGVTPEHRELDELLASLEARTEATVTAREEIAELG